MPRAKPKAKYEDLVQQVKQKEAENLSTAEKRTSELKKAEADLAKARIELKKGPILAEIERSQSGQRRRARREPEKNRQRPADC